MDNYLLGISISCLFIAFLVFSYFKFGKRKPTNSKEKLFQRIGLIAFIISPIAFIFPILLSLLFSIYSNILVTYHIYKLLFYTTIISLFIGIISYVVIILLLRFTTHYQHIASLRIISLCSIFIFLICTFISTLITTLDLIEFLDENDFTPLGIGSSFIILLTIGIGTHLYREFYFIAYEKRNYLLYLRSFNFDKNEHSISEPLKILGLPILKIGNPQTLFPQGLGDVFYLPSSNWKKQLDYYINRAKYIFSVVDVTEGVLWEMFEHLDQSSKFIYHISNKESLKTLINNIPNVDYKKTYLMECFVNILNNNSINKCTFYIKNKRCYYADTETILRFISNQSTFKEIPYFELQNYEQFSVSHDNHEPKYYKHLDLTRFLIRIFRRIISGVATTLSYLTGKILDIITWVTILLILIGVFIPNEIGWIGRIFMFCLAIIMIIHLKSTK